MLDTKKRKIEAEELVKEEAVENGTSGDLTTSIKECFHSSKFSDLTVCTKDQEFKVHKIVISGQSEFFSRLLSGNWKETTENTVQLKDHDPRAVQAMIEFMYGFDYGSSGSEQNRISPMLFNVKVYQVGDIYGAPKLKDRAKDKFEGIIRTCWRMDDFPAAITEVYSTTPAKDRGLRDLLVRTSLEHIDDLKKNEDFVQVLQKIPGFAGDLIQHSTDSSDDLKPEYQCFNCDKQWQFKISVSLRYCPSCLEIPRIGQWFDGPT